MNKFSLALTTFVLSSLISGSIQAKEQIQLPQGHSDVIRDIMLQHLPQLRSCYQARLDKGFTDESMVTKFTIGAEGKVVSADIKANWDISDSDKSCFVSALKEIVYPKPMGGGVVEVTQPLAFKGIPADEWKPAYDKEENKSYALVGKTVEVISALEVDADLGIYKIRIKTPSDLEETITCKMARNAWETGIAKLKIMSKRDRLEGSDLAAFNCSKAQ